MALSIPGFGARSWRAGHTVSGDIYENAVACFGEQGVVELIATIGYYTMVSMTLNAFEIETATGEVPFPR